ncbi:MAG: response regulator [Ignavibacteriaceae bacterium]
MLKILVAEDEKIVALDIQNTILNLGYDVTSIVNSGEEVLQKVESEKPDLILMDITLKGDASGIECAQIISKKYNIPCIFLSGYSSKEISEKIKDLNNSTYLKKPFDKSSLAAAIGSAIKLNNLIVA